MAFVISHRGMSCCDSDTIFHDVLPRLLCLPLPKDHVSLHATCHCQMPLPCSVQERFQEIQARLEKTTSELLKREQMIAELRQSQQQLHRRNVILESMQQSNGRSALPSGPADSAIPDSVSIGKSNSLTGKERHPKEDAAFQQPSCSACSAGCACHHSHSSLSEHTQIQQHKHQ